MKVVGVTGHRHVDEEPGELIEFARLFVALSGADLVVTGMALGWDMAVAQACVDTDTPFIAAVPFPTQAARWPVEQQDRWIDLCNRAQEVVFVGAYYRREVFEKRNHWIVRRSNEIAALLDEGRDWSGTHHCVLYAQERDVNITLLWDRWLRFRQQRKDR